ncbi:MAG: sel1 repeat family protein, partial [Bradyrhizobium sp.]
MAAPGFAFDGAPANQDATLPLVSQPAAAALNAQALKKVAAPAAAATVAVAPTLNSLQYAAEGGHPVAQWKLG